MQVLDMNQKLMFFVSKIILELSKSVQTDVQLRYEWVNFLQSQNFLEVAPVSKLVTVVVWCTVNNI